LIFGQQYSLMRSHELDAEASRWFYRRLRHPPFWPGADGGPAFLDLVPVHRARPEAAFRVKKNKRPKHIHVVPTPQDKCQMCGKIDELRPYGPGGQWICYDCGMKDKAETERQFKKQFLDKKGVVVIGMPVQVRVPKPNKA
jgi:hypothetical protein